MKDSERSPGTAFGLDNPVRFESSLAFEWLGRILGSDGVTGEENRFLKRAKSLLFD